MAQVIAYLVRRIGGAAGSTDGASHQLTALMVQATPVLEALGNAATVRNHNSSRFGKFVKLVFERGGGRVCALRLQTFLLEKSRAAAPPPTEATFHIFYYLLGGASRAQRSAWQLRDAKSHALTATAAKATAAYSAAEAGVRYERMLTSLTDLGLNAEKQQAIFEILAGVLHLVDVSFAPSAGAEGKEGCAVADPAPLRKAAKLLGVGDLESALTSRTIRSGGRSRGGGAAEEVKLLHTAAEAAAARDALAKAVYTRLFDLIVRRVNEVAALCDTTKSGKGLTSPGGARAEGPRSPSEELRRLPRRKLESPTLMPVEARGLAGSPVNEVAVGAPATNFIGLLDMFGFEVFDRNGFEQLCINYANEKLHQFFIACVFKAEEETHISEGVPWPKEVSYDDNAPCLALCHGTPTSLLTFLDEACQLRGGTESALFQRVATAHARSAYLRSARRHHFLADEAFVLRHFAGDVLYVSAAARHATLKGKGAAGAQAGGGRLERSTAAYETAVSNDSWLAKNADRLLPDLVTALAASESPLTSSLFDAATAEAAGGAHKRSTQTVATKFCAELDLLIADLGRTSAHFIRCIKPNGQMAAASFDGRLALDQLRALGMIAAVEMMQRTFPTRVRYSELHGRYARSMPPLLRDLPPAEFCEAVALACEVPPADYALGATRLFLRPGAGAFFEELSEMSIDVASQTLLARIQEMQTRRTAATFLARALRTWQLRRRFQATRAGVTAVSANWRGRKARRRLHVLRAEAAARRREAEARRKAEEKARREAAEKEAERLAEERAAAAERRRGGAAGGDARAEAEAAASASARRGSVSGDSLAKSASVAAIEAERKAAAASAAAAEALDAEAAASAAVDATAAAASRAWPPASSAAQLRAIEELRT